VNSSFSLPSTEIVVDPVSKPFSVVSSSPPASKHSAGVVGEVGTEGVLVDGCVSSTFVVEGSVEVDVVVADKNRQILILISCIV
jgi:hypothetical protein